MLAVSTININYYTLYSKVPLLITSIFGPKHIISTDIQKTFSFIWPEKCPLFIAFCKVSHY